MTKTEREIELEKKLEIAIEALEKLSEETLLTEGGGRFVNTAARQAQEALKVINKIQANCLGNVLIQGERKDD